MGGWVGCVRVCVCVRACVCLYLKCLKLCMVCIITTCTCVCRVYRFTSSMPRIKNLITKYGNNLDVELQQRAVEYSAIFSKHDDMRLVV